MRLWSLHPKHLDTKGLVALWRESLLAQAVLLNKTKGYKNHPQLIRFREKNALPDYLWTIYLEGKSRGYHFDSSKIYGTPSNIFLNVTTCQIEYEWSHLKTKLYLQESFSQKII